MVVLLGAELALRLVLAKVMGKQWVLGLKKVTDSDLVRLKASGLVKETETARAWRWTWGG
jgi:hypothetical protein